MPLSRQSYVRLDPWFSVLAEDSGAAASLPHVPEPLWLVVYRRLPTFLEVSRNVGQASRGAQPNIMTFCTHPAKKQTNQSEMVENREVTLANPSCVAVSRR